MTLSAVLGAYAALMVPVVAVGLAIGRVASVADDHEEDLTRRFLAGIEREPVSLGRSLNLAREAIDMPVAYLAEVRDGCERVLVADGRWSGRDATTSLKGLCAPIDDARCRSIEKGGAVSFGPALEPEPVTGKVTGEPALGAKAWIGAPVTTRLERRFVLCCAADEDRPMLGQRELRMLTMVADGLARQLDAVAAGADLAYA